MNNQQQKFFMGPMEVRTKELVDPQLIKRIPNFKEALRQCMYLSGRTAQSVGLDLGIMQPQMSRIMCDHGHFPDNKIPELQDVCLNLAALQWWANREGYRLVKIDPREKEIEELESRINELKGRVIDRRQNERRSA